MPPIARALIWIPAFAGMTIFFSVPLCLCGDSFGRFRHSGGAG
jgi:hypothetical protein